MCHDDDSKEVRTDRLIDVLLYARWGHERKWLGLVNGALVVKAIGARSMRRNARVLRERARDGDSLFEDRCDRERTEPSGSGRQGGGTLSRSR